MKTLFSTFTLREKTFKNRIFVSPMCQYSSDNGLPGDWHLVHLGSRAVGGAALVMVEATAVSPQGRISPWDSGIWSDEHGQAFKRITAFIKEQGAVPAIQLAHAGRKASTDVTWRGGKPLSKENGGWEPVAPSAIPFDQNSPLPRELTPDQIETLVSLFAEAARRSLDAGFETLEIHMAHGYLLHEFLSPISNHRQDQVRRHSEKPDRISSGSSPGCQGGVARTPSPVRSHFLYGLGGRGMGSQPVHRILPDAQANRGRPHRLFQRRSGAGCRHSRGPRLSGPVFSIHTERSRYRHRSGRLHYLSCPGGTDNGNRSGGCCSAGP